MRTTDRLAGSPTCANVAAVASALPRSARFAHFPLARSLARFETAWRTGAELARRTPSRSRSVRRPNRLWRYVAGHCCAAYAPAGCPEFRCSLPRSGSPGRLQSASDHSAPSQARSAWSRSVPPARGRTAPASWSASACGGFRCARSGAGLAAPPDRSANAHAPGRPWRASTPGPAGQGRQGRSAARRTGRIGNHPAAPRTSHPLRAQGERSWPWKAGRP